MVEHTPGELGAWLRERRRQLGLTQPELAELARVGTRSIREIEHGRARTPYGRPVLRLLAFLKAEAEPVELDVLGPLVLRVGGRPVESGTPKQAGLLALLGLHPGTSVSRDEIVDVLWADAPPATCLNLVHTYVTRLRRLLASDGVLHRTRDGYLLALEEHRSDVARFTALAARVTRESCLPTPTGTPGESYGTAETALRLWRGPVLQGALPAVREYPSATALTRLRLSVLQAYADGALALDRAQDAVPELQKAADLEPLHEGVHARLMLALAASGQQAAALHLYQRLRERLDEQLGVRPGREVAEAHLTVVQGQVPRTATAPVTRPPALLPYDVPFFTGRPDELSRLDALFADGGSAIGALTGPAGAGKTALAVHWAHRARDRFPDGQLFVDLRGHSQQAPVRPNEALARFLLALGTPAERIPGTPEAAADLYRTLAAGRRMLVVLDNAVDAEQVRPLLPGGPGCAVLVTSRDRLAGLAARDGAHRIGVDVLTPREARLLLVRTVGAARVDADPQAAADLARACGHLPLALRIAAANLGHSPDHTLREQADELREGDRLSALSVTGDRSTAVRSAFALSYQALDAEARRMFRLLSLIPGPETGLHAAAAVAGTGPGETARVLDRLTAAHLLREHRPGRYRFHDLLALYAAERLRLEETDTTRRAAATALYAWLLAAVDRCAHLLYPGKQRLPGAREHAAAVPPPREITDATTAMRWLDTELTNLAAAVHQAAADGDPASWWLADGLRGYAWTRKLAVDWTAVGVAALESARAEDEPLAQAGAHNLLGHAHLQLGRADAATDHFERFLALAEAADWHAGAATAHTNLSTVTRFSGRLRRSAAHLEAAVELDRRSGLVGEHPVVLDNLGHILRDLGRLTDSLDCLLRAERLPLELDSEHSRIHRQANIGLTLHLLGEPARAACRLDSALAMARQAGDRGSEGYVLRLRASACRDAGDLTGALELARTAAELSDEDVDEYFRAAARITLGGVQRALGRRGEASETYREALKLARERDAYDQEARALLGLASLAVPVDLDQAATALEIARRTEYVLVEGEALTLLARGALDHGDRARAAAHAREALALQRGTGYLRGQADALAILEQVGEGAAGSAVP
ncbi:BTAD domain-containing putative transcriptional regulator [Streptomyces sp. ME02-8801-2C]|uniref:BTAD domain-containing putative transcriptional regulator n=1 Tax=Streptomyces sp. ME02-8801-2C TaxID=3028680 RepID=UPI0029AF4DA8|nr:BTAD domain-containing putative transcriptional regulator [Streptomyces sp. ME02-8801-2C]MDX3451625.1 BTAD domain-containing putative transcriptional regulator [Streptomyces sp. ME02-8801-2C]